MKILENETISNHKQLRLFLRILLFQRKYSKWWTLL